MNNGEQMNEMKILQKKVLKSITPNTKEREATLCFVKKLEQDLAAQLLRLGVDAEVSVQGSIAKDTWLAGDKDVDTFILLPTTCTKANLIEVLQIVKSFVGDKWIEAYVEHPYLIAEVEGYQIDFVPGFKIDKAEDMASSVDRSPLHTAYIKQHLDPHLQNEVRLFKQFSRGIGTYGAEIKIKGLSGYLCELLILHYRSFLNTLRALTSWKLGHVIDVGHLYSDKIAQVKLMFKDPLIVIDPVDSTRNVASAVSTEKLGELMMAANLFLSKPTLNYFFPEQTISLSTNTLDNQLSKLRYDLLFIVIPVRDRVPDVLWGQIYKTSRALKKLLVKNDFQVLKNETWSDETELVVLVYALEIVTIPRSKLHHGPPVDSEEAIHFIKKYALFGSAELGPWTEDGRWVVEMKRRHVDAVSLLNRSLQSGGKNIGVAHDLTEDLKRAQIYLNREILDFYSMHEEFAKFLTDFLYGRPKWMKLPL
jgi:tRNA nucleotidyltransferase (CCA-adding enzyme)